MAKEFVIPDLVVASVTIDSASTPGNGESDDSFSALTQVLKRICQPHRDALIFVDRYAHHPIYANSDGLAKGCNWTDFEDGGGEGEAYFERAGQDGTRVRLGFMLAVAQDKRAAWLTVEFNPTTMLLGDNIHPAMFIDPETGKEVLWPSSDWKAMSRIFRLGFHFLEEVGGADVFDPRTKALIERGDFHLVRVQWAAAKEVKAVPRLLQLLTVVYDQTIARGWGVINIAAHLGLEFEPYINGDTRRVTGVKFTKRHGTKLVFSTSLYDKQASMDQKHRVVDELPEAQQLTVKESVREDITAHSEGILIIIQKARKVISEWGEEDLKLFDFLSPEVFLSEEPKSTLWWLQRAIYILSHYRHNGMLKRFSFGVWLVPYIEDEVLRFDVIANIQAKRFHQILGFRESVAEAWRNDEVESRDGWAERLAKAAKVSVATVYNRQRNYSHKLGIDIALPCQLYADVLHFGQSSMAAPETITKMLMAANSENGAALVQLYNEALANFEHDRLTILNPTLSSRPRALLLESPKGNVAEPEGLSNLTDEPDLIELDDLSETYKDLISLDDLEDLSVPEPAKVKTLPQSKPSARGVPLTVKNRLIPKTRNGADVVQKKKIPVDVRTSKSGRPGNRPS